MALLRLEDGDDEGIGDGDCSRRSVGGGGVGGGYVVCPSKKGGRSHRRDRCERMRMSSNKLCWSTACTCREGGGCHHGCRNELLLLMMMMNDLWLLLLLEIMLLLLLR